MSRIRILATCRVGGQSSLRYVAPVLVAALFATAGCGGSSAPTAAGATSSPVGTSSCSGGTARGTMSARIDGVPWTATCIVLAKNDAVTCQCVAISGGDSAIPQLVAGFGAPNGVGTYPIGPPLNPANGVVILGSANPPIWSANAIQGSGTATISTLTATSASGTFAFNAVGGVSGGATSTRVVTDGVFNVTF